MWPSRRYWIWSLRVWSALVAGFIVLTIVDGQPGDLIVIFWSAWYWAMLSVTVALVLFTGRAITRAVRR
jgi:hypothetical protein